jgi:hypothetical protein
MLIRLDKMQYKQTLFTHSLFFLLRGKIYTNGKSKNFKLKSKPIKHSLTSFFKINNKEYFYYFSQSETFFFFFIIKLLKKSIQNSPISKTDNNEMPINKPNCPPFGIKFEYIFGK